MPDQTTISKIRLINGTTVNLSSSIQLNIPAGLKECNVTWNITNFTGSTSLISGTVADYLLTINEQRT